MEVDLKVGARRNFTLQSAVLIYRDGSSAFATVHEIRTSAEKAPYLSPGQPVTNGFLRELAKGLEGSCAPVVLPENILAKTADVTVWWSSACRRVMFFGDANRKVKTLSGSVFPHPALVFKVAGRELYVRALSENQRPSACTALRTAPYWNTDGPEGRVCLGSMRVPSDASVQSFAEWEKAYFVSEFTHPSGTVRLTSHPGGFVALWASLARCKKAFPAKFLTDAKQTLREFVEARPGW